ncbi:MULTISPECIES: WD40/YVTN/BNR-like repeat-containing protein [Halorubrum]|uniref:Uncharacterized protein n=1 Tax=Halorubrum hochstenium ATCC 700873 TaxID=1227481 RepID=M0F3G9_9EURY|nr:MULTISPECIES: hypothetical protein [Halorubrum]ELZ53732.1 hypothetical protein C467_12691 [Halorubrum hochstenium ATCC 700873]
MSRHVTSTRRAVMAGLGAIVATGSVTTAAAAAESEWTVEAVETDGTLHDVVSAAAGRFAVGGGGVLTTPGAHGWKTLRDGGPTGNGNDLYGASVTDDGERVWFVGASGAIGEYIPATDTLVDHSAPLDNTNNYNDVAVTGEAGEADVYVAGDSGKIYYSFENGEEATWDYVTPGSGSGLPAIDFHGPRSGHAIDTNGRVFATDDGVTWNAIGIEDANATFYGLDSDAEDDVAVSGGNGTVLTYDGANWTPDALGDADLVDVETDGQSGYVVGSGGVVQELTPDDRFVLDTPTGENLNAVDVGGDAVVVGSSGTVLRR